MTVLEIVERARSRTVSRIKDAIETRSLRTKVHTEPAIRAKDGALAYAPDGLKLPLRWDFYALGEPDEKNADSLTLKLVEPASAEWGSDMQIEFISVCWDCMIFRLSPARSDEDWTWLSSWFMRWFDADDQKQKDSDGLYRVVHFISDPEPEEGASRFFVDFGSAETGAFMDLLDRVSEQGYTRCVIGDEKQPQPTGADKADKSACLT
ncbi:MAG: hypothetical protein NXI02_33230 [Rhodobacteraceae bacterium]|nr:hypothetical protein [Paracoccaceae bacterium]